jgi:hypothetical protein
MAGLDRLDPATRALDAASLGAEKAWITGSSLVMTSTADRWTLRLDLVNR